MLDVLIVPPEARTSGAAAAFFLELAGVCTEDPVPVGVGAPLLIGTSDSVGSSIRRPSVRLSRCAEGAVSSAEALPWTTELAASELTAGLSDWAARAVGALSPTTGMTGFEPPSKTRLLSDEAD